MGNRPAESNPWTSFWAGVAFIVFGGVALGLGGGMYFIIPVVMGAVMMLAGLLKPMLLSSQERGEASSRDGENLPREPRPDDPAESA